MAGQPFDFSAMQRALGGGMGGPGMPMPDFGQLQEMLNNPDMQKQMMEAMQNDPTIRAFQEVAEAFTKDPEFVQMTQELQRNMMADGGSPDPTKYMEAMGKVFTNDKYMKKAEELGKAILTSNPDVAGMFSNFMHQSQDPAVAAKIEESMRPIKEDPEFKQFTDLMEEGKPAEAMKYLQENPVLAEKYNAALQKAFEAQMSNMPKDLVGGAAAAGGGVDEELVDLHTAASEGDPDLVKQLLGAGAGVDEKDDEGRTALHFACGYGELECAKLLLDKGASVDSVDNNKNTALHYAAGYGQEEAVRLLLKHKADLNAKNQDGNVPLQVAQLNEHTAVAEILQKAAPPKGLGMGLSPKAPKKVAE